MEQRVSIITLGVADVAASRRFYECLGWKASSVGDEHVAFFQVDRIVLAIYDCSELAKDTGLPSGSGGFSGVALAYNVRHKDDVDTVLAEAAKAGARILKPAEYKFWGGYSGYLADPDDHPWEVAWNPGFLLTDDGGLVLPE